MSPLLEMSIFMFERLQIMFEGREILFEGREILFEGREILFERLKILPFEHPINLQSTNRQHITKTNNV